MLAGMPDAGRMRDEIEPGLRSFPVEDFIIYYRKVKRGGICISRVIHAKQAQRKAMRKVRKPDR
jgi:toxin ParE1/3/4